jgi:hypothetical protein|eukprot:COSAG03_NODE_1743_length_3578_cov_2.447255_2_plen_66_part_00
MNVIEGTHEHHNLETALLYCALSLKQRYHAEGRMSTTNQCSSGSAGATAAATGTNGIGQIAHSSV